MKTPVNKINKYLFVILAVYTALAISYSIVTKPGFGPDEPAHIIYIRSMSTQFSPPLISTTETHDIDSQTSHEGHQPPLYYALLALPAWLLGMFGATIDATLIILRLLTAAMGAVWIYAVYMLVKEWSGKEGFALTVTGFIALLPGAAYMAGVINNDILVSALITGGMVWVLRLYKRGELSTREAVALGVVSGLAISAKAQGLVLLPMIIIAALSAKQRNGGTFICAGIAVGLALVISVPWFVRCYAVYGTIMPHSIYKPMIQGGVLTLVIQPLGAVMLAWECAKGLWGYFWMPYWLMRSYIPWKIYSDALVVLSAVFLAGALLRIRREPAVDRKSLLFLLLVPVGVFALWFHYVLNVDSMANSQGRLMLPGAAAVGILGILGLEGWIRNERIRRAVIAAAAVLLFALNLFVMWAATMQVA